MKKLFLSLLLALPLSGFAESRINHPDVKSLQVVVNGNWLAPAIMRLNSNDVLHVSFDELSHDYHRYIYRLEHCEADWTPSEGIFESDWLSGFNGNTIDDYQHSTNTIIPYTHYQLQLPNARCSLKISGNYRLHVLDEDDDNREVLVAEFMVTEQKMKLSMSATGNTDVDTRQSHQQVSMQLDYGTLPVTNPDEQIYAVVMQNTSLFSMPATSIASSRFSMCRTPQWVSTTSCGTARTIRPTPLLMSPALTTSTMRMPTARSASAIATTARTTPRASMCGLITVCIPISDSRYTSVAAGLPRVPTPIVCSTTPPTISTPHAYCRSKATTLISIYATKKSSYPARVATIRLKTIIRV